MWAVILTSAATVISMIDQTIVNTALPTIAHDVNATAAASIWVINGFQLGLTVGIVPLAAAGDIFGYWRMFRVGLIVFVLASLACCFSQTLFETRHVALRAGPSRCGTDRLGDADQPARLSAEHAGARHRL